MASHRSMAAARTLNRLQNRCTAAPAMRNQTHTSSPALSRLLLTSSSPLSNSSRLLSAPHARLFATATASAASHSTLPPQSPINPPQPAPLSPSQLRAASAARAQKAVADAKAFEIRRARTLRNKNIALGLACIGFVVWCYWFSVYSVRKSADSLTGTDVVEIERELDEEDRLKAGERT